MVTRDQTISSLSQQLRETIRLAREAFALFGDECDYGKALCDEALEIAARLCAA